MVINCVQCQKEIKRMGGVENMHGVVNLHCCFNPEGPNFCLTQVGLSEVKENE
ncbi:MAG TPA: hypothetical protein VJA23_00850 [Candidatus Nanoarchaeia archaeon]|nr:hypothetical protein [Candidatus Nanoarchaeia archaeon]